VISIKDLIFSYKKSEDLFFKLNLDIKPGVICGLLGKNGVGKTTLLRLIAGLLFPQKGNCTVLNYQPQRRLPEFLQDIYYIPEEFSVPAITIMSYLKLYAPFYPSFSEKDFLNFAKELDLPPDKKLTILSYGQKKKFLIAFALASNCKLLLLDEPTNGLDIPSKGQFRKLLASSINEERTIIISTHQVRDLQNLLDTVIILDDGKITFNQAMNDVSKKLIFQQHTIVPPDEKILYAEKVLGGYMTIQESAATNQPYPGLEIDLEVLFNAVMQHKEKLNFLFEKEMSTDPNNF